MYLQSQLYQSFGIIKVFCGFFSNTAVGRKSTSFHWIFNAITEWQCQAKIEMPADLGGLFQFIG